MTGSRPLRSLRARLALTTTLTGAALLLPDAAAGQTATTAGIVTVAGTSTGGAAPAISSDLTATTTVGLKAGSTVLDWGSLNVANGQTLNFQNLTGSATTAGKVAVLNRVDPANPLNALGTSVRGTINGLNSVSTGTSTDVRSVEVWISNPNGILIGDNASISTNGLVLTTLPIGTVGDDGTAFTGTTTGVRLISTNPSGDRSSITGTGTYAIATNGGVLAIVAPVVQLTGTGSFDAGSGDAAFVAATDVTLQNAGSPLSLTINQGTTLATAGTDATRALDVAGSVAGNRALMVVSAQKFVDTLLNVSASVTTATTTGNGVVILAGNAATNGDAVGTTAGHVAFAADDGAGTSLGGGGSVQIGGTIDAGTAALVLGARSTPSDMAATNPSPVGPGRITEAAGGVLNASLLSARSDGALSLTGANNAIQTTTALASAGGAVALTTDGALTVDGGGASGTNVILAAGGTGALTIRQPVVATGAVDLTSGAGITLAAAMPAGAIVSAGGQIVFRRSVTLASDALVASGGTASTGPVFFQGTVNGTQALTVTSAGSKNFVSNIGTGAALTSLTTTGGATMLYGSVRTSGSQSYDTLTLAGTGVRSLTATTGGAITFNGTVEAAAAGTQGLATSTSGITTFGGTVGHASALASVSVGGPAAIDAAEITTSGGAGQSYGGTTTLGATAALSAGAGNVTFAGALTGGFGLSVDSTGTTSFAAVGQGAGNALAALTVNSSTNTAGATLLNGSVTTSGAQTYWNAVTTTAANGTVPVQALTSTTSGGITFQATLDGTDAAAGSRQQLALATTGGATTFNGTVGGTTRFASLTVGGPASIGADVTADAQSYDAVTLSGGTRTLTGATTFNGAVGAATATDALVLTGGAAVAKQGLGVGSGVNALGSLDAGALDLTGDIATNATQAYTGLLTVHGDATLSGTVGSFAGTGQVLPSGTPGTLTLAFGEAQTIAGDTFGVAGNRFAGLTIGPTASTAASKTLVGNFAASNAVTVNDAAMLGAGGTGVVTVTAGTGGVTFASTVGGAQTLAVDTPGAAVFAAQVGTAATPLTGLTVGNTAATATTTLRADVYAATQTYANPTAVVGAVTLTGGTRIEFDGNLSGGDLTLAGAGPRVFAASGGVVSLALLTSNAGGTLAINGGGVSTTGAQTYNDAVMLGTGLTTLTGTTSTIAGTVTGSGSGTSDLTLAFSGASTVDGSLVTAIRNLTTAAGGTTTLAGTIATTGTQSYNDTILLGSALTTVSAGANAITFAGTVDATAATAQGLSIQTSGTATFGGLVGGTTPLASLRTGSGPVAINTTGIDTDSGGQVYGGAVTLGADAVLTSTGGGTIGFASTVSGNPGTAGGVDHSLTLTTSAIKAINGGFTGIRNLTANGGGSIALSGNVSTSGYQLYGDSATLGAATRLASSGTGASGAVTFGGTLDGGQMLEVDTAGVATFIGNVGNATSLRSITVNPVAGAGSTAIGAAIVRTTGGQAYNDAVVLAGGGASALTSTAGGDILFGGTVDAATAGVQALSVVTAGTTTFGGAVGTSALDALTTDAAGATRLNGGAVTTVRAQGYGDPVTLGANTVLTGGSGSFGGSVTGAGFDLALNFGGTTVVNGSIGGVHDLSTGNGGTTALSGTVATSGRQTYTDAVLLGGTATVLTSSGGGAIAFGSTVDATAANQTLTVTTGGTTTFGGVVGGAALAPVSVTVNGAGATAINTGAITTSGAQRYTATVLGGADLTTLTSTSGGAVTFAGTLDALAAGVQRLAVATGGTTVFAATVGGAGALQALVTGSGGTTAINADAVTTTGAQTYNEAVTLGRTGGGGLSMLTSTGGGAVTFAGTVNAAAAGAQGLSVRTGGMTTFAGLVGGGAALGSLATDAGGTTAVNGGGVFTTGAQGYGDQVTLAPALGTPTTFRGGSGAFGGGLQGNGNDVALEFGGATAIDGGSFTGIGNLRVGPAGGTAGASTRLAGAIATAGTQTYNDAVVLADTATLTSSGNGAITFNVTIDGSGAAAQTLAVRTGGATTFNAAVGGTTTLGGLTTDAGGSTTINAGIAAASQGYGDAVTIGAGTQVLTAATGLAFGGTVDGPGALVLAGGGLASFASPVGAAAALASLQTGSGTTTLAGGTVTTIGAQTYGGAVTLGVDTRLVSGAGGTLRFGSTVDGAHLLSLTTTGAAQANGAIGGATALTGLALRTGSFAGVAGNRVGTLAAAVPGGFAYDDAGALTIGTVDGLSGIGTGTAAATISAGGPLTLATNVVAGTTALTGGGIGQAAGTSVNAGTGTVTLDGRQGTVTLAGTLTTANATAAAVRVIDAGAVTLGTIATGTGGTTTIGQPGAAAIGGNVTQTGGATISTGTLVGSIGGSATLTNAGNNIATLGALTANGLALRDGQAGLTVAGPVNAGTGNLALTLDAGTLALAGDLTAATGSVTLTGGGAIVQGGGVIIADTLAGSAVGGASFTSAGNAIGRLAGFTNAGSGAMTLVDGKSLAVIGDVSSIGDVTMTAPGIDFAGRTITAGGALSLAGGSGVVAGGAAIGDTTVSITGAGLNVAAAQAKNGALALTATGGSGLTVGTASTPGAATLSSQGALAVTGSLNAGTSAALTATGAATLGQITAGTTLAVTANGITAGSSKAGSSLSLTSGGGITLASGQAGGDASFDANGTAALGAVTAGSASAITTRALDAQITGAQSAARVAFVNRAPGSVTLKLGNATSAGGFQLSQDEVNLVNAGALTFDGGAGNVEVGTLAFNAAAGSGSVTVLSTGRIDVLGAVSGSGANRLFRLGGTAATTDDKAAVIQVVATAAGGGRLLFDTADLDLRGGRIGVGQAAGFLDPLGFAGSGGVATGSVATAYVGNANSGLYNATYGGVAYPTNVTLLSARSLTVRYTDYALFQNTGAPGVNAGVALGGTSSAPVGGALTIQGTNGGNNAFALFGTINGISGSATALLGSQVIITANVNLVNTRVNGCLVGSGAGCLNSVVAQPTLDVFDASRLNIFRSADDLVLPFDPVVGGNNEALFSGVDQFNVSVSATDCAGHDDPSCRPADGKAAPDAKPADTPNAGEAK